MLGKQSYPATRQGKTQGTRDGGRGAEPVFSLMSLAGSACRRKGGWAELLHLLGHQPLPGHMSLHTNTSARSWCAMSPPLGKAWAQPPDAHCSTGQHLL